MAKNMLEVTTDDGKYTVIQDEKGGLRALRYGEEWTRDLTGDGLVLALAYDLEAAQERIATLEAQLNDAAPAPGM